MTRGQRCRDLGTLAAQTRYAKHGVSLEKHSRVFSEPGLDEGGIPQTLERVVHLGEGDATKPPAHRECLEARRRVDREAEGGEVYTRTH